MGFQKIQVLSLGSKVAVTSKAPKRVLKTLPQSSPPLSAVQYRQTRALIKRDARSRSPIDSDKKLGHLFCLYPVLYVRSMIRPDLVTYAVREAAILDLEHRPQYQEPFSKKQTLTEGLFG